MKGVSLAGWASGIWQSGEPREWSSTLTAGEAGTALEQEKFPRSRHSYPSLMSNGVSAHHNFISGIEAGLGGSRLLSWVSSGLPSGQRKFAEMSVGCRVAELKA
jgi:hypothetical protein